MIVHNYLRLINQTIHLCPENASETAWNVVNGIFYKDDLKVIH